MELHLGLRGLVNLIRILPCILWQVVVPAQIHNGEDLRGDWRFTESLEG